MCHVCLNLYMSLSSSFLCSIFILLFIFLHVFLAILQKSSVVCLLSVISHRCFPCISDSCGDDDVWWCLQSFFSWFNHLLDQLRFFFLRVPLYHYTITITRYQRFSPLLSISPWKMFDRNNIRWAIHGSIAADNYMFKVNNRNTRRRRCEIFSKLTKKTPERRQWRARSCFCPFLLLTCIILCKNINT